MLHSLIKINNFTHLFHGYLSSHLTSFNFAGVTILLSLTVFLNMVAETMVSDVKMF